MDPILLAFVFIWAINDWCEGLIGYVLECFRAAYITGIRIDLQKGFDFGNASNDPTNSDQAAQVDTPHVPDCHSDITLQGLEVEITI